MVHAAPRCPHLNDYIDLDCHGYTARARCLYKSMHSLQNVQFILF